ncbi:ATP synthase subunit I [Clostridium sp.]|jgi:ATP synthase protein I
MNKDIVNMVKKVSAINLLIGISFALAVQTLFDMYGLFVIIGMVVGIFNFFINSVVGGLIFDKLKDSSAALYMISFILRIVIAAVIGYIIFTHNKYGTVAYLFGYTSHLLGIYIYSAISNN